MKRQIRLKKQATDDDERDPYYNEKLRKEMGLNEDQALDKSIEVDKYERKEEEEMLIRLAKIRPYMWT